MATLNLLRTIHCPLHAEGRSVINSFGVVIATCTDEMTALGVAELVNLGVPAAEKENDKLKRRDRQLKF